MKFQIKLMLTLFCVVALTVVGCKKGNYTGPELAPAEGIVTYDGAPLAGANISMSNSQGNATAVTDASGKFKMQSAQGGRAYDGVPIGALKVAVHKNEEQPAPNIPEPAEGASEEEMMKYQEAMQIAQEKMGEPKSIIPKKYNNPTTSGLDITIAKEGNSAIKIDLTKE